MTQNRTTVIEELLRSAFAPAKLLVKDQSHLHAGHAGAQDGKGHFEIMIVSDKFAGVSRIGRHRMVYDALGSFMASDIHALKINAISTSEL